MGVQVSLQDPAFNSLDIHPEVEFLGLMVILFLIFKGTTILFSTVAAFYIPSTQWVPIFPHLHQDIAFCYFDNSHPNECEVVYNCSKFSNQELRVLQFCSFFFFQDYFSYSGSLEIPYEF